MARNWRSWKMRNTQSQTWNMARNSENRENLEMYTVGSRIWWESWKISKMRQTHCFTWNMVWNTQKRGKWEMHTVGPGVWQENWKHRKWDTQTVGPGIWRETDKRGKWETPMVWHEIRRETLKNVQNEKHALLDLEYCKKQWNMWKMRNAHCRTWNIARKLTKSGKEKIT